jgi:hypothetical protein
LCSCFRNRNGNFRNGQELKTNPRGNGQTKNAADDRPKLNTSLDPAVKPVVQTNGEGSQTAAEATCLLIPTASGSNSTFVEERRPITTPQDVTHEEKNDTN